MIPAFPVYIFDVDGTLLDSARDICGAVEDVLRPHVSQPLEHAYLRKFIGFHLDVVFADAAPHLSADQRLELLHHYRRIYPERGHAMTSVYGGIPELLGTLPGLKTTATTKGTPTTRAILSQFGLAGHFHHIQGTDGFPCKPEPDVILRAIAGLGPGIKPEDCLFVGDSTADMEAGRKAGVRTCAVLYGYGDPDELRACGPDFTVSRPRELSAA